jgi:hypothetical protein
VAAGGCSIAYTNAPPITIRAGGQYTWVIDSSTTVSGVWRLAQASELKYGYEKRGTTAILLAGESGKNWLVSRELTGTSDGRDRILIERTDLGLSYRGNRIRQGPISVPQHDTEQSAVDLQAAVVVDETHLPEPVHEVAHP